MTNSSISLANTPSRRLLTARLLFLALALAVLIGLGRPDTTLTDWGHVFVSFGLAACFATVYWRLYKDALPFTRQALWLGLGIVLVVGVTWLRLRALSVYPSVNLTDEPWDLGWAISFLRTGRPTDWIMFTGAQDVPLFYAPYSWWLHFVGAGLWEARLFTFGLCGALIVVSMLAARNLYGNLTAAFTGVALFCSANLWTGARIRHDVALGLALMASLWLYTEAVRRKRDSLHLLAGICIGLGLLAHYHAVIFGGVLLIALYFTRSRGPFAHNPSELDTPQSVIYWRGVLLYAAGGIGAGLFVFLIQIVPQWGVFLSTRGLRNPSNVADFINALLWHITSIPRHSQYEFVLIVVALVVALRRSLPSDRMLTVIILLAHLALALVAVLALDYYVVPLTPFYVILVAALIGRLAENRVPARRHAAIAVLVILMLPNLLSTLYIPAAYVALDGPLRPAPPSAAAWILANVKPDQHVMAEPEYFFWLTDYRFSVPLTLDSPFPKADPRTPIIKQYGSIEAAWEALNADVFIFDPNLSTYAPTTQDLRTSGYLERHGYQLVATFIDQPQPVTVYQRTP